MPNMDTMLLDVQKANFFAQMDMSHSYFQVSIHPEDRRKHTFRGADSHTLYEPLLSLQGAKNSGFHLQVGATQAFKDIAKKFLIWLDDWLLHATTFAQHMDKFLALCRDWNFTLSPAKCNLVTRKAKWGGRIITADGITLDPRRIDELLSMQIPETAGDLQQLICAINWMHKGIPEYNKIVGPLQALLLTFTKRHGFKKKALEKVQLGSDIWTPEVHKLLEDIKQIISDRVTLSHLDPDNRLCMKTDASEHYKAGVLTQIPQEDAEKSQAEKRHEPLPFVIGALFGAMYRW